MSAFELLEEEPITEEDTGYPSNSAFSMVSEEEMQEQQPVDPLEMSFNLDQGDVTRNVNENSVDKFMEQLKAKEESEKEYRSQSYLSKLWQNVSGLGVRGAEAAVGIPNDIKSFANFMLLDLPEYTSGHEFSPEYRRTITGNPIKPGEEGYEEYEKNRPIGLNFPSSEDVRQGITKPISGEYFEPKNKQQKFAQDTIQDIVRFLAPGNWGRQFSRLSPAGKIIAPIYANLGKEIAQDLGFTPTNQELIKMGLMLGMDVHSRARTRDYAGSLIHEAESMVQPGQLMNARRLDTELSQLETNLRRGGSSPSTARALQAITEARQRIFNGEIDTLDAMTFRKRLNDVISSGGGYDVPHAAKPAWTRNMQEVKNTIIGAVDRELSRTNPQAANLWRQGNEAFSVYSQSTRMGNWIRKQTSKPFVSNTLKLLFPAAGYAAGESIMHALPKSLTLAAPVYGAIKAYQITTRSMRSPTVRRYYQEVMSAALKENAINFSRSIKKLDKALKEEEAKDPLLDDLVNQ